MSALYQAQAQCTTQNTMKPARTDKGNTEHAHEHEHTNKPLSSEFKLLILLLVFVKPGTLYNGNNNLTKFENTRMIKEADYDNYYGIAKHAHTKGLQSVNGRATFKMQNGNRIGHGHS